jgi:hypothetical protein
MPLIYKTHTPVCERRPIVISLVFRSLVRTLRLTIDKLISRDSVKPSRGPLKFFSLSGSPIDRTSKPFVPNIAA